jgi:hypothetical protein
MGKSAADAPMRPWWWLFLQSARRPDLSTSRAQTESPLFIHHGGRYGVTGSCHELRLTGGGPGILIDCGLFEGDEARHSAGPLQCGRSMFR